MNAAKIIQLAEQIIAEARPDSAPPVDINTPFGRISTLQQQIAAPPPVVDTDPFRDDAGNIRWVTYRVLCSGAIPYDEILKYSVWIRPGLTIEDIAKGANGPFSEVRYHKPA